MPINFANATSPMGPGMGTSMGPKTIGLDPLTIRPEVVQTAPQGPTQVGVPPSINSAMPQGPTEIAPPPSINSPMMMGAPPMGGRPPPLPNAPMPMGGRPPPMTNAPNNIGRAPPLAGPAEGLAGLGRMGDDMLVHMNKAEVAGLASLSPIGGLTTNPDTGMPEAFAFLLPMLGGLAGSALAPAAASALMYSAIGSGLGGFAQGMIQDEGGGKSLQRGLLNGLMSFGMGSIFGGAGDAAAGGVGAAVPGGASLNSSAVEGAVGGFDGATFDPTPVATAANINDASMFNTAGFGNRLKESLAPSNLFSGDTMAKAVGGAVIEDMLPPTEFDNPLESRIKYKKNTPEPGDTEVTLPDSNYVSGLNKQHRFFKHRSFDFATGGTVPALSPQDAGIASISGDQMGEPVAGQMLENNDDQRIIAEAKMALMGRHPEPEAALLQFGKRFGEEALAVLIRGITMRQPGVRTVEGPGGPMSDSVPAVINDVDPKSGEPIQQPAALSPGEVVLPTNVVAAAGEGSVPEGAARLKEMSDALLNETNV